MPDAEFRIIRSARRRRIALRIGRDGVTEILSPPDVPDTILHRIAAESGEVIAKLRTKTSWKKPPKFFEGENFMLLGKPYPLRLTQRLRLFDEAFLIPRGGHEQMKQSMIALYRQLAAAIIDRKMPMWEKAAGISPAKVRISSAGTRWGSCSAAGTISFSWQLAQCPPETVDCVIVHELVHLHELNHSRRFWMLVEKILPDHRERRKKLREFAATLPDWDGTVGQKDTLTSPETDVGGAIS